MTEPTIDVVGMDHGGAPGMPVLYLSYLGAPFPFLSILEYTLEVLPTPTKLCLDSFLQVSEKL